jgi:hypothetical protein
MGTLTLALNPLTHLLAVEHLSEKRIVQVEIEPTTLGMHVSMLFTAELRRQLLNPVCWLYVFSLLFITIDCLN